MKEGTFMNKKRLIMLCLLIVAALSLNTAVVWGETYQLIAEWGTSGIYDGQFSAPYGVAVDDCGNVYVADTNNHRIQKFTSTGDFITKWGGLGIGDGQFDSPMGVAVDGCNDVYVADSGNERIQKFTSTGEFIAKWGGSGFGDGQFYGLSGIAVDASGNVYVAEFVNDRIQKFSSTGDFITKWGVQGIYDGQFQWPSGIAVDASGNVYVVDGNSRIQKFSSAGDFITKWGGFGMGDGQFMFTGPFSGIAVDASGNVYVADSMNIRIQKFSSTGDFITKWGGPGSGLFEGPHGVAVDVSGAVYVADTWGHRIRKFAKTNQTDAYLVKGNVRKADGSPLAGAEVTLAGGPSPLIALTNSLGVFKFKTVPSGNYTLTPQKAGFEFSPKSRNVTVAGANVIGQNFVGLKFSISGTVKKGSGAPIPNVMVALSGDASKTVLTDANGFYKFGGLLSGNYTVTPAKTGWLFAPESIAVNVNGAKVPKQNFTGTKQ
jgi:sugar lactone lactonase YvrE